MRIVIDMQGAQTPGSRNRGIGRYTLSLVQGILRLGAPRHEIIICLNGAFADSIAPVRAALEGKLPQENIRVWQVPGPVGMISTDNEWRRQTGQLMREAFLASLKPDFVLITSLFEGLGDDFVGSVGTLTQEIPTAVVLYDLIPMIQRKPYLDNPVVERWYETRLDSMRRADLLLSISESSRQEGLRYLDFAPDACVNISTAADPHFQPMQISAARESDLRERLGIKAAFLMYTGGIDHRKNIEGLIRAYALLPRSLRALHQLAIVCSIQPHNRSELEKLAREHGLERGELVLTGYVSEKDLISLYNLCTAFVFPSWHEGFGLPALEAMSCGRAVVAANTSSLPEVVGRADALFDPRDDDAIAAKLEQVLGDTVFRAELERHGPVQARNFSWDLSAQRALGAMEAFHARRQGAAVAAPMLVSRPRMAFLAPLPPSRTGIADYSAELLPELARHYEIDVITAEQNLVHPWINANCRHRSVEWFRDNADQYDRVLYQVGNSSFHQHMFSLIEEIPGVVVLHDFYLSGVAAFMELTGAVPGFWGRALYDGHGYPALRQRFHGAHHDELRGLYPCNIGMLRSALGVIVHSECSRRLARQWNGPEAANDWDVIPHLRVVRHDDGRAAARHQLGLDADDFVVCSFGLLAPSKLNHRLLDAWKASALARSRRCVLVFVGENEGGAYGAGMLESIRELGPQGRVLITGWADTELFRNYLAAADVGVQLRTFSRGETSGAVLDCMNYGLATIVNANGSMADLPDQQVMKLPDEFSDQQLVTALEHLWQDEATRLQLGESAHSFIRGEHSPRRCADQYARAIESTYRQAAMLAPGLMKAVARVEPAPVGDGEWVQLAQTMAENLPAKFAFRQLLLDVSDLIGSAQAGCARFGQHGTLLDLLLDAPAGYRVEPVFLAADGTYWFARRFSLTLLDCPEHAIPDEVAEFRVGDLLVTAYAAASSVPDVLQNLLDRGVRVEAVERA